MLTQTIPFAFASAISLSEGAAVSSLAFALEDLVAFESFAGAGWAKEIPSNTGPIDKIKLKLRNPIDLFIQFVIGLSLLVVDLISRDREWDSV